MNNSLKNEIKTRWQTPSGELIACGEKIRVLDESLEEALCAVQDALDDAVLVGCSAEQYRQALLEQAANVAPSVKERTA